MTSKIDDSEFVTHPLSKRIDISYFHCTNSDLNDFLKNDALRNQEQLINKTYVCYYQNHLVGYFTLTTDTIQVKSINSSDCVDDFPYSRYPALKLARLATDEKFQRMGVGSYMLHIAIYLTQKVSDIAGCRYITVDSKPQSVTFYTKHSFKLVEESRKKEYPVLYLNMQPIIEELEPIESLEPYIKDGTE
ncbi:putative acetyltransferase [Methanomethylovorans hollandica DSM 15978]|uniref:Putative acetyltransferase n=1 Tax=Methanomethylovorans hollandica (strain DSM 15978 / NBRC 107637 / DMS1) TaxID=867904 RepID=L0KY75_METHD|nr:GNAT family N-acetyltransferase [Methanomethylovorans hollandica]AGB48929.1 putative acetyltransferase [Methanomethylovorans hollandica DSM 15978]